MEIQKILLNPKLQNREYQDKRMEEICEKTIGFFEKMGLAKVKEDNQSLIWYSEFLDFIKDNEIFSTLLTPDAYAIDNPNARWDTWRICQYNEILAFYGLCYWYTWKYQYLVSGQFGKAKMRQLKRKLLNFSRMEQFLRLVSLKKNMVLIYIQQA